MGRGLNFIGSDPIWEDFSTARFHAPSTVAFEILNEPNGKLTAELWNGWAGQALAIIRETNPTRNVPGRQTAHRRRCCGWQFDSDSIAYDIPKDEWVGPIHTALVP